VILLKKGKSPDFFLTKRFGQRSRSGKTLIFAIRKDLSVQNVKKDVK